MSDLTFIAAVTDDDGTLTNASRNVAAPAGDASGSLDLMIVNAAVLNPAGAPTLSMGAGWTQVATATFTNQNGLDIRSTVFVRTGSTVQTETVTASVAAGWTIDRLAYSGQHPTTPFTLAPVFTATASSTAQPTPAFVPTLPRSTAIYRLAGVTTATSWTPPGAAVERTDRGAATAADLTQTSVAPQPIDGQLFTASAANITITVALVVNSDYLRISTQPQSQIVTAGTAASFSVTATGGAPSYSYQWQDDTNPNGANISGATSSSYAPISSPTTNGRRYRVVITDTASVVVTSDWAQLFTSTSTPDTRQPRRIYQRARSGAYLLGASNWGPSQGVEKWFADELTAATGGSGSSPVGTANEQDASLALTRVQIRATGLGAESDASLALSAVSARAAGLAEEQDSALALAPVQIKATGLAGEQESAIALTAGGTPAGVSAEQDSALALAAVQIRAAGLSAESDAALALGGAAIMGAGLAAESDSEQALAAVQIRATGVAQEQDTALALTAGAGAQVGIASETDEALALSAKQIALTGLASETDVALTLAALQVRAVGLSVETDAAQPLVAVQVFPVGLADEANSSIALAPGGVQSAPVGVSEEQDIALALSPASPGADPFLRVITGYVESERKKKRGEDKRPEESVVFVEAAPKPKRGTIRISQLIGKTTAPEVSGVDIAFAEQAIRRKKRQREEDDLLLML